MPISCALTNNHFWHFSSSTNSHNRNRRTISQAWPFRQWQRKKIVLQEI